jgi:hypothetical protein
LSLTTFYIAADPYFVSCSFYIAAGHILSLAAFYIAAGLPCYVIISLFFSDFELSDEPYLLEWPDAQK